MRKLVLPILTLILLSCGTSETDNRQEPTDLLPATSTTNELHDLDTAITTNPKPDKQLTDEEIIQLIREEFAAINDGTYIKKNITYQDVPVTCFYQDDNLRKMTIGEGDEVKELYYATDGPLASDNAFFIYDHGSDNRYYYNTSTMIRWIDSQGKEHDGNRRMTRMNANWEWQWKAQSALAELELQETYKANPGLKQFVGDLLIGEYCEMEPSCIEVESDWESDHGAAKWDTCWCGNQLFTTVENEYYWSWWAGQDDGVDDLGVTFDEGVETSVYYYKGEKAFVARKQTHTYLGKKTTYTVYPDVMDK